MKKKKCIICLSEFETSVWNKKVCSEKCFKIHAKNRKKISLENNKKDFICKECGSTFSRSRKRSGFCSRSCASKFHIKNGTYDKWKNKIQEKNGINKKCLICGNMFYAEPREIKTKKICGNKECRKSYMGSLFAGANNPFFGKKHSLDSKIKKEKTLLKKYNVKNAFELSKNKITSKAQKEIFERLLKECSDNVIFLNKTIKFSDNKGCFYLADIFIEDFNVIIEYNGDYWHCNSDKYKEDYFNKKKKKFANQIWEEDNKKYQFYTSKGYNVIVVWEDFYKKRKDKCIKWIFEKIKEINEKEKNTIHIRSSVEGLADIKFGELLESPKSHVDYSIIGNDKCECLKTNMDWVISSQAPKSKDG